MEKEKCFALRNESICTALTEGVCLDSNSCPFYKGISEAELDARKINDRIVALPYERRISIAQKYYDGKMKWEGLPDDR